MAGVSASSIRGFQKLMSDLYLDRDRRRGPFATFIWLSTELGEFGRALIEGDKSALEDEAADILAWLASICNLLDIDLEAATSRKYTGRCPRCRSAPCVCSA